MSHPDTIHRSPLVEAIAKLGRHTAIALGEETHFRLPVTMKIADADLCTYLARNECSFLFLPDYDTFTTRLILRTTNEAWRQDKLPTLAICPTEHTAKEVQRTTGIQSVSAEMFFSDLERSRPVIQNFTGKKSYVIGHDANPRGKFDDIVLPSFANMIVYDAHQFSPKQLAALCEPISQVRGRLILCANWTAIDRAHPDIAESISDALGYGLPDVSLGSQPERAWELGNDIEAHSSMEAESAHSNAWVIVATSSWEIGVKCVRSIHTSREDALKSVPAVFAEEWKDYAFFFDAGCTEREAPTVSLVEWRAPDAPDIGQRVRIENDAVISLINLDERFPLRDELRSDTRDIDPLSNTRPFLVFHAKTGNPKLFPDDYTLVAKIEAGSIDHAVFLSQHRKVPWTQNPGITSLANNPRSTQVGDVVIDHDIPKRYVADNDWRPVTTVKEPVQIHERAPASIDALPGPEPVDHRISASSRKF